VCFCPILRIFGGDLSLDGRQWDKYCGGGSGVWWRDWEESARRVSLRLCLEEKRVFVLRKKVMWAPPLIMIEDRVLVQKEKRGGWRNELLVDPLSWKTSCVRRVVDPRSGGNNSFGRFLENAPGGKNLVEETPFCCDKDTFGGRNLFSPVVLQNGALEIVGPRDG